MTGLPRLPPPQCALHLYRHLLREAGYLPPVCRPFITNRIQVRFRRHQRDRDPGPSIKKAGHDLRLLRAANAGDITRMRRVMLLAFGRIGPKRRELVDRLVAPDPPADTAALAEQIATRDAVAATRKLDFLDRWDLAKLTRFVRSQASTPFAELPRPKIRNTNLDLGADVPKLNIWGRPMHPKPARTKLRKNWKDMVNRVLPPIDTAEWDLLRKLSTGEAEPELWEVPPRRPAAKGHDMVREPTAWDWQGPARAAVRHLERSKSRRFKLLSREEQGDGPFEVGQPLDVHRFTPRFWRRAYVKIWTLTAKMERHEDRPGAWNIEWGGPRLTVSKCSPAQLEFFEGVDAETEKASLKSSRTRPSKPRPQISPGDA